MEEGIDQGDDDLTSDEDEEGDGGMRGQAAVTRKRKAPLTKEETLTTMAQYTVAKFKMFESKTVQMGEVGDGAMDRDADYGSSVDDLHFENYVNSASSRYVYICPLLSIFMFTVCGTVGQSWLIELLKNL